MIVTEKGWAKACSADSPQCVEVRFNPDTGNIVVRDSKAPMGSYLVFGEAEWTAFVDAAKKGQADYAELKLLAEQGLVKQGS